MFGYYYHLATANGLIHRGKQLNGADGDRPFVLSRAFFSGTQRVREPMNHAESVCSTHCSVLSVLSRQWQRFIDALSHATGTAVYVQQGLVELVVGDRQTPAVQNGCLHLATMPGCCHM